MAPRYQIRLKNLAGGLVAVVTDWYFLSFRHQVNGVGSYELRIDGDLDLVDLFALDGQLEIWRSDIAASPAIPLYMEWEGFHRTTVRQTSPDGRSLYSSLGPSYDDLLNRRIILYAAGSAQAEKAAVGETVMKEFVDENAGPGATSPPRLLSSGVMTGFTVEADGTVGAVWTGARAKRNLLDTLVEVANDSGVDFGVVGTGPATFQFQAKLAPWGSDRTNTGLDEATGLNAAGNAPVIFSLVHGNMEAPSYSLDRRGEVTAALVLGQGQEADRQVVERTSADIADSTWNRIEASRQGSSESTAAGLNSIGDEFLDIVQKKEVFSFKALQIPSTLYGRDYFLGDLVTARYNDIERDKKIVSVDGQIQQGKEVITLGLSDVPLR